MHIQFRIWSAGHDSEIPAVGEPTFDPTKGRIGVFNNRYVSGAPVNEWYPCLTPTAMLANVGQVIGGYDSNGAANGIVLDWSTPGKLRVLDRDNSNAVLADFHNGAQVLQAAASIQYGLPGPINRLINSGLGVRRRLIPNQAIFDTTNPARSSVGIRADTEGYWETPMLLAPNCFAWKATGSDGNLVFALDESDLPPAVGAIASVKVTSVDAPSNAGVTFYDYDYASIKGRTIRASVYLKGDLNRTTRVQLRSENGGVLAVDDVTGTGDWVWHNMGAVSLPDDGSSWLAFDALYQPGGGDNTSCIWRAAAPSVSVGPSPVAYEIRTTALEEAMASALFREVYADYDGISSLTQNVNMIRLLTDLGDITVDYKANDDSIFSFPTRAPEYISMSRTEGGRVGIKLSAYVTPNDNAVVSSE